MTIAAGVLCGVPICLLALLLWCARSRRRRERRKDRTSVAQKANAVRIAAWAQSRPHQAAKMTIRWGAGPVGLGCPAFRDMLVRRIRLGLPFIMNKLADKRIRSALKSHLARSAPVAILDEVRVHNGNAIADVVTVDDAAAHCYEIKGEGDEIRRIVRQGAFYDLAFIRTTLVTTQNHLSTATALAPEHWGILVASEAGEGVVFRRLRNARKSPHFSKEIALLTLWRSELISLCTSPDEQLKKLSREKLAAKIAVERPIREITHHIGDLLVKRQANKRWSLAM